MKLFTDDLSKLFWRAFQLSWLSFESFNISWIFPHTSLIFFFSTVKVFKWFGFCRFYCKLPSVICIFRCFFVSAAQSFKEVFIRRWFVEWLWNISTCNSDSFQIFVKKTFAIMFIHLYSHPSYWFIYLKLLYHI